MTLKKDLVIKVTALTSEVEKANKTIATLTQKNKELSSNPSDPTNSVTISNSVLTQKNKELLHSNSFLVKENEDLNNAMSRLKATNYRWSKGRAVLISMPWYKRIFLTSNRIHSILINGEL